MKLFVGVLVFVLLFACQSLGQQDVLGHLRLKDRLDRATDGYCLDILGVGQSLRVDVPMFAHNCKPRLTPDSKVRIRCNGRISLSRCRPMYHSVRCERPRVARLTYHPSAVPRSLREQPQSTKPDSIKKEMFELFEAHAN